MNQINTRKNVATKLRITPEWLSRIIDGKTDAGYNLAVKMVEEIGGTIELWKTSDDKTVSKRAIVWHSYLIKLEKEKIDEHL